MRRLVRHVLWLPEAFSKPSPLVRQQAGSTSEEEGREETRFHDVQGPRPLQGAKHQVHRWCQGDKTDTPNQHAYAHDLTSRRL
jgi:hypothetical protein